MPTNLSLAGYRLLYISPWHGTMEYDELSLFTELGLTWFSTGFYADPANPLPSPFGCDRPAIKTLSDPSILEQFRKLNPNHQPHTVVNLTTDFVKQFNLVVCAHNPPWHDHLLQHWPAISCLPVAWRTYGQQPPMAESIASRFRDKGLWIVRVSPRERLIPNHAWTDAVIRVPVDINKYPVWRASSGPVLTFCNFYHQRHQVSNTRIFEEITRGLDVHLHGYAGDGAVGHRGFLSRTEQLQAYANCGVYFALGSKPAPLTYNLIEAMACGCPVVTWGEKLGTDSVSPIYEVPWLFENGQECYYSDDPVALRSCIKSVLENPQSELQMGLRARLRVRELFSPDECKQRWKELFARMIHHG